MLYRMAVAAVKRLAGALARLVRRFPAGMRALKALPVPGKRLIVYRLSPTGLPSLERARVGRMLYDLDLQDLMQRAIYFDAYEKRDLRTALRHTPRGGVCLDIGSCVGYYALNLARKVGSTGTVHAFEPDSQNHERLVQNCLLNGLDGRVLTHRVALSDRSGESLLHKRSGRSGDSTIAVFGDDWPQKERVRTDTLDEYLERNDIARVDFAKIDVEGHEFKVLKGATRALKTQVIRKLLIEFNGGRLAQQGYTVEDFLGVMNDYGYVPALRHRPMLELLRRRLIDPEAVSVNFLFRPVPEIERAA